MKNFREHFKFSMILALTLGVLVSCSDDAVEQTPTEALETQQPLELSLLAPTDGPIIIDDLTDTALQEVERATTAPGEDRGRFNITLKFVVPPTERQEQVFNDAAARWERIIIGDVPSFTGTIPSAFANFPPAVDGTLDDIVIEVALAPIDGPGGILGQAGPRFVRTSDYLTLSGVMFFDVADLDFLESLDLFEEVIVHEMGHVLGVGTLWNINRPNFNRNLLEGSLDNPYFSGQKANVFWNAEGGTGFLPIEADFGPGTAYGHWDEGTLRNELMTGFLNLGENPLSRITAGSMRDLGYRSASVGESYELPKGTPGVDPEASATLDGAGLHIASREILLSPIGFVVSEK